MCNLYRPTPRESIQLKFGVSAPIGEYPSTVAPLKLAPFVTAGPNAVVGQWGMIPANAPTRKPTLANGRPMSTNNARCERVAVAPTYRRAWKLGQRCLIPAESFDEPYWGVGKNIWWRFWRSDGEPWALAGIWDEWTDPATGEVVPNFSMLTQNCDGHKLLSLMHKPDPKFPLASQDKRAVVPVEKADWKTWLSGSTQEAESLIKLPVVATFRHAAADPSKQVDLP